MTTRSVDILVWLYRNHPDRFTIADIMRAFDLQRSNAHRRVSAYMHKAWGAVKPIGEVPTNRPGGREIIYALTKWGRKYAAQRAGQRRMAANPEEKNDAGNRVETDPD